MSNIVEEIEKKHMKENPPKFNVGDTVKVFSKVKEGEKERLQGFEGIVIGMNGGGVSKTFTVRKLVQGVGVERIFLIHSPRVDSVKVLKKGKPRRAKLYYLRGRIGTLATKVEEATETIAKK
ncbi:MAG: 50S ribosomal protein L19 [Candidatus Saganbacteria bacterium]|nr:50S ribosomal protein L19 [Candidatus Saganbacteria bacterium]